MKFSRRNPKRGIALIVVLLALMVLGTVAGGVILVSSNHLMHAASGNESQEALYAARSGAWTKLGELREDASNLDPIATEPMPNSEATYSATVIVGDGTKPFPPKDAYYIEGVGTSAGGKVRKIGILARLTESRWNHAAFGNKEVVMMSGSYTDSFNSDGLAVDNSEASVATNNDVDGIVIEDNKSVVIGWNGALDASGHHKDRHHKDDGLPKLVAEANAQGPPGSSEHVVVKGPKDANRSYNTFVTATSKVSMDPVTVPSLPPGGDGALLDPASPLRSIVDLTTTQTIAPGAYDSLVVGPGGVAQLDVSGATAGETIRYTFNGIHLLGGQLEVLQPDGGGVTVEVYVDTGDGTDPTKSVEMVGGSVVNKGQKPIELQFLIAGKGKNVLEGYDVLKDTVATPFAYYVAYAPEADIVIKRGQVFGAVVANRVTLDGDSLTATREEAPGVIHFDTTLLEDTGNPPMVTVLSVREY